MPQQPSWLVEVITRDGVGFTCAAFALIALIVIPLEIRLLGPIVLLQPSPMPSPPPPPPTTPPSPSLGTAGALGFDCPALPDSFFGDAAVLNALVLALALAACAMTVHGLARLYIASPRIIRSLPRWVRVRIKEAVRHTAPGRAAAPTVNNPFTA